jgi:hypothetical protein
MDEHDNHGQSLAAWVAVGILLIGFAVGSLAVAVASVPLFIVAVVILVVGVIAGKVLAMAGYGVAGKDIDTKNSSTTGIA